MTDQPDGAAEAGPPDGAQQAGGSDAQAQASQAGPESTSIEPAPPPRRRWGKSVERPAGRSPRLEALTQRAQRAQQTMREGLASARESAAVDRALEASRAAREAARPRLSNARQGVQQRITDHPDAAAKVARALTIAVVRAAAGTKPDGEALKNAAPKMGDHVGKAVGKLIAKSQRPATPTAGAAGDSSAAAGDQPALAQATQPGATQASQPANPAEAGDQPAPAQATQPGATQASQPANPAAASDPATAQACQGGPAVMDREPDTVDAAALANSLGVRPPPDPAALYRDGPGPLELLLPLPDELASLPWSSLSRRNRFYVLVAAWALREADGIDLLKGGHFGEAAETFQECLIRAGYLQTAELVARSYTDLAELAAASGDEPTARRWQAAAAQAAATAR